jgi:hypothetical protein
MHKSMLFFTYLLAFSLSACIQDELEESSSLAKQSLDQEMNETPTPTDPTPTDPTPTDPTETTTNTVKSLPKISILDVQTDHGYSLSQYSSRDLSGRVTYMIGVYETRSDHHFDFHPIGSAQVEIEAQIGPIALILSSYEPTIWHLSGPGVAQIDTLIFLGYHTQEVVAEGLDAQPQSFNIDQNQYIASIYQWPTPQAECIDPSQVPFEQYEANQRICDAREVQDFIRAQIHEEIDAFSGTYVATQFLIHGTVQ